MDHLSAAGSSATRNLTTTEPSESLNRRKTVDFRFQRPYATSGSFFFNKPMRAMDSRRDFTSKKVFSGYFSELGEKANSALIKIKTKPSDGVDEAGETNLKRKSTSPPPPRVSNQQTLRPRSLNLVPLFLCASRRFMASSDVPRSLNSTTAGPWRKPCR